MAIAATGTGSGSPPIMYVHAIEWAAITFLEAQAGLDIIEKEREGVDYYLSGGERSIVDALSEHEDVDPPDRHGDQVDEPVGTSVGGPPEIRRYRPVRLGCRPWSVENPGELVVRTARQGPWPRRGRGRIIVRVDVLTGPDRPVEFVSRLRTHRQLPSSDEGWCQRSDGHWNGDQF